MSLSINLNNNQTRFTLQSGSSPEQARAGLDAIRFNNKPGAASSSGVKVNFTADYNTKLTESIATSKRPMIPHNLMGHELVHFVKPERVSNLLGYHSN